MVFTMRKIILTGATSGIGHAMAKRLANDYELILGCRNEKKANILLDELKTIAPNCKVTYYHLDLSSFSSIENFCSSINNDFDSIDVLVNNAGVFMERYATTSQGFEMTIGVNFIGTYYLTTLLEDILSRGNKPQIINICSKAGLFGKYTKDIQRFRKHPHGFRGYAASKQLAIMMSIHQSRRLKANNISVNAIHPGKVATNMTMGGDGFMMKIQSKIAQKTSITPDESAQYCSYIIENEDMYTLTGKFLEKEGVEIPLNEKKFSEARIDQLIKVADGIIADYTD
jgi:NAD(P)-dependent dehydrogenase (short-subunit alcohol dehydrogenase family)